MAIVQGFSKLVHVPVGGGRVDGIFRVPRHRTSASPTVVSGTKGDPCGPLGTMLVATLPLSAPLLAEVPPGCFPYRILLQGTGASEAGDRTGRHSLAWIFLRIYQNVEFLNTSPYKCSSVRFELLAKGRCKRAHVCWWVRGWVGVCVGVCAHVGKGQNKIDLHTPTLPQQFAVGWLLALRGHPGPLGPLANQPPPFPEPQPGPLFV